MDHSDIIETQERNRRGVNELKLDFAQFCYREPEKRRIRSQIATQMAPILEAYLLQ